ncbi:MAG: Txe/YoeB family addiction module toxin [Candidatus Adiutrix sp.]|jgi:toxin YoeB|nr:Txe/YoeB family addiction module toxin [Candidatus Adiutrix sp.]
MRLVFSPVALENYHYFKEHAPQTALKIKRLLESISQTPHSGLGKPEPLKHGLSGFWSRRIDREHRLVYKVDGDTVFVASCRYHY